MVGYFAPEVSDAYVALGLDARLAYFPGRAAAFGAAGAGLTTATFYVFAPWLVQARAARPPGTPRRPRSSSRPGAPGWPPR